MIAPSDVTSRPRWEPNVRQAGYGLNVLLLSDDSWDRTVTLAVAGICDAVVHRVRSLPAALAQLAGRPPISCILVQASHLPDSLRLLQVLARGGRPVQPRMIILGNGADCSPDADVLTKATPQSLSRLLANIDTGLDARTERPTLRSQDVAAAIDASGLVTRYQPIVAIADLAPFALEVLARLEHPLHGTMVPDEFVPQMEDAGLARKLTETVIDCALADHAAHLAQHGLPLTVNVPLDVLMHRDLADWLTRRCARAGVAADRVIIELTESQPVANLDRAGNRALSIAMADLRRRGYRLAIDDFGPEMPRRQELFTLPLDLLKLDKAVVNDVARSHMVAQAVASCRTHGLKVIAEGVEEAATWTRMQELGVDYVQGYLVSRPLPARNVGDWLDEWRQINGRQTNGRPAD